MAKKKADLQVDRNLESTSKETKATKKSTTQKASLTEGKPVQDETPLPQKAVAKTAKKVAEPMPAKTIEDAPLKKATKKTSGKKVPEGTDVVDTNGAGLSSKQEVETAVAAVEDSVESIDSNAMKNSADNLSMPLRAVEKTVKSIEQIPVKKATVKKTSSKKAKKEETDNLPATPAATGTQIENKEAVTIAEEKNDAFIHKLTDVAEHHQEIHPPAEKSQQAANIKTDEKEIQSKSSDEIDFTFIVNYFTKPGQSIFITAHHPLFGNGNPDAALPMSFLDDQHWQAQITISKNEPGSIVYNYLIKEEDGSLVYDGGKDKKIVLSAYQSDNVVVLDAWDFEGYYENAFFTEPFKEVLFKQNATKTENKETATYTHVFKVKAPLLLKGQAVCITGSTDALHNWNTGTPNLLQKTGGDDYWHSKLDLKEANWPVSYKYGVFDIEKNELVHLESGDNRVLYYSANDNTEVNINDGFIHLSNSSWKGAGVAIPVFSLRTENSWGVGEFADIKMLADWSHSVGLQLIQLLPVNDTTSTKTWRDSYPYAAISAFALHAMYLNMDTLVSEENKNLLEPYKAEGKRLNELSEVDYEAVNDIKWKLIHDVYPLQKEKVFASDDYKNFFEDNKHWLVPYALFCTLRDRYNTADASLWSEYKKYDADVLNRLSDSAEEKEKAGMYYFVQYHLHLQLKDAADYAHSLGIVIKGDIPIGVARHGADAWQHPELFHLDMQAGAPPDPFAVKGQNWSFPTYNWQHMKEDGFAWWKQRFSQMSNYFDAFRIDHILGFFRIWSIPVDSVEGIMGHFVPALPVHISEFHQWNTYFDYKRYTKPFINDQIIQDLCGDQAQSVKDVFLVRDEDGTYSLRQEVSTQQRVETYFAIRERNGHNQWLKQLLFDLISNVILFEEKGSNGQLFHFRFGMEKTLSYQYMDNWSKHQLYFISINYFYERQNEFWRGEALQKLPALKLETDMLVCGEDLGLVPASVPRVMQDLGLLSLEVQRMPKDENATFTNLERAPYLSVVTPSTHDMSTVRGWWEEDKNVTQNFYNNQLGRHGEAPHHCEPDINKQVIEQHVYSPAMWSIFQLQDLMGIDAELRRADPNAERINVPAIPQYYWRYRMHLTLEELMNQTRFNDELKEMLSASGRSV